MSRSRTLWEICIPYVKNVLALHASKILKTEREVNKKCKKNKHGGH